MSPGGFRSFAILLLAAASGGCGAAVYPPDHFTDPVPFYLARYSVHSSVLLPSDGTFIDYSFGDWNYAALHHKLPNDALGALTISGQSAYERRIMAVDPKTRVPIVEDNPQLLLKLYADRAAIAKRVADLEDRFQNDVKLDKDQDSVIYMNANQTIIFVKDPQRYSWTNNCNYLTADTLRALGYRVEGETITNQFHLQTPLPAVNQVAADASVPPR